MLLIIENSLNSYINKLKKLQEINSGVIFSTKKDNVEKFWENKRYTDEEKFYFFSIENNISKDIVDSLNYNYDYNENNNIKVLVHFVENELSEEILDNYLIKHIEDDYIVCSSSELESLSILIAKLFYKNDNNKTYNFLLLNMIEPNHEIRHFDNIEFISRKNNPFEYIVNSDKRITDVSMIIHGNGENLYLGNVKMHPNILANNEKDKYAISHIFKKLNTQNLLLASCLGMKFGRFNSNTFESLINSPLQSFITFRGIKDNYFAECSWYIILKTAKYGNDKIVQIINYNIKNRTNDVPMYVAVGWDQNYKQYFSNFSNYSLKGNYLVAEDEHQSRYGKCLISNFENEGFHFYSLTNKQRIHWVISSDGKELYFMIEGDFLPREIELINTRNLLEKVNVSYDNILELKGSWSKSLKNSIVDQQNQLKNLISLFNDAKLYSDYAIKFKIKQEKLYETNKNIEINILKELTNKQNSLSPISEVYSPMFEISKSSEGEYEKYCTTCNKKIVVKRLHSIKNRWNRRKVYNCFNCGQIKDVSDLEYVNVENIDLENNSIKLIINVSKDCIIYPVVLSGETNSYILEAGQTIYVDIEILKKREYDTLKIFSISSGMLNVSYHNLRMEN